MNLLLFRVRGGGEGAVAEMSAKNDLILSLEH